MKSDKKILLEKQKKAKKIRNTIFAAVLAVEIGCVASFITMNNIAKNEYQKAVKIVNDIQTSEEFQTALEEKQDSIKKAFENEEITEQEYNGELYNIYYGGFTDDYMRTVCGPETSNNFDGALAKNDKMKIGSGMSALAASVVAVAGLGSYVAFGITNNNKKKTKTDERSL